MWNREPEMDQDALQQSIQARREMLAEWRAKRLHELALPSGLVVTVRDASVMDLIINGNVPQTLLSLIMSESEGKEKIDLTMFSGNNEYGALIDGMVKICLVDPPVAEVADETHLGIGELPGEDKMAIFNHANREVEQVKTFRAEPAEPVPAA
jgi:hypothetical protein